MIILGAYSLSDCDSYPNVKMLFYKHANMYISYYTDHVYIERFITHARGIEVLFFFFIYTYLIHSKKKKYSQDHRSSCWDYEIDI